MSLRQKSISVALSLALCLPLVQTGSAWALPNEGGRYSALSAETLALIEEVESAEEGTFREDSVLVTLEDEYDAENAEAAAESLDADGVEVLSESSEGEPILNVTLPDDVSVAEAIAEYSLDPAVKSVQPNYIYELIDSEPESVLEQDEVDRAYEAFASSYPVNDPFANISTASTSTPNEWYLDSVNAQKGWSDTRTNNNVTVAVIDTGINFNHIDLKDNIDSTYARYIHYNSSYTGIISESYTTSETTSRYGHGTHVAGIVAARANNSQMFAGTSYNATILPIKTFIEYPGYSQPITDDALVITAYNYIFKLKDLGYDSLKVINLSLGGDDRDASLESVINKAKQQYGILTVCAAGNENTSSPVYPSDFPEVISVTSVNSSNQKSDFSNYGTAKDIAAPGTNIWSTYPTSNSGYAMLSGTSMAAPVVSGAAALLWAKDPSLSVDRVKSILCSTTTSMPNIPSYYYMGTGKLNIEAALASIEPLGRLSISSITYTGSSSDTQAAISVSTRQGDKLTYNSDYTLTFKPQNGTETSSWPVNAGTYTVTAKGLGSYSAAESITGTLVINPRSLGDSRVSGEILARTVYTGYAQTPLPTLSYRNASLIQGVDYELSYSNNVNAGSSARAICTGKGNFTGSRSMSFAINKDSSATTFSDLSFKNTTVPTLSSFATVVTGSNGRTLTQGTDYSVVYRTAGGVAVTKPSSAGTYSVFVTGNGAYSNCTISGAVRITSERTVPASVDSRISRITQGTDATGTAAAISSSAFATSEYVIIARFDSFEDAMSATGLAGILDAPILLTNSETLSPDVASEVKRLNATKAYVIGGTLAVKPVVVNQLLAAGIASCTRLSGQASWDTSLECAKEITRLKTAAADNRDYAIIATPMNFQDALSVSSFAYKYHVPILLQQGGLTSQQRSLSGAADSFLKTNYSSATIFVPGGVLAVSDQSIANYPKAIRLTAGMNAYDTCNYIANYMVQHGLLNASSVTIASGSEEYKGVDALAGAALAGKGGGVMLLMDKAANGANNDTVLKGFVSQNRSKINDSYVLGGILPMPINAITAISSALR